MFNYTYIRDLENQLQALRSSNENLRYNLSLHEIKQQRNEYIRMLLSNPSPASIEFFLKRQPVQPFHIALRCLTKKQLRKELVLY